MHTIMTVVAVTIATGVVCLGAFVLGVREGCFAERRRAQEAELLQERIEEAHSIADRVELNRGFMLLELVITMAVLTILLTMAMPSAVAALRAGQQINAVQTLKTTAIAVTRQCVTAGYTLTSQGYTFTFTPSACDPTGSYNTNFTLTADPTNPNNPRHYYIDGNSPFNTVRYSDGSPATGGSHAL